MTDIEILKIISRHLTDKKNSSALSDYDVLCNNINYLNTAFKSYLQLLSYSQEKISEEFESDASLNEKYQSDKDLNSILPIINRIVKNSIVILKKYSALTKSDVREGVTMENIHLQAKRFDHYNELITASRQLVDSLISDSYQLCLLEPKNINYHVLVSLSSFNKYASKSISSTMFNDDLRLALTEFESFSQNQWKNSSITQCAHTTFGSKVDHIKSTLGGFTKESLSDDLKNIFKFSSEFTHIGYTSTLFTSSDAVDAIFCDEKKRPYLLSMENFSEIKYELLETACWALINIYTPSILACLKKTLKEDIYRQFELTMTMMSTVIKRKIKSRNSKYYFFIKDGLIGSKKDMILPCVCGRVNIIKPPHESHKYGCKSCGSSFTLYSLEGDPKYIFTTNGPVKVIGCDCPEIEDLPDDERNKLFNQWLIYMQEAK